MSEDRLIAASSTGSMKIEDGSSVLLAAHTPDNLIGLGVLTGPISDLRGRYNVGLLVDALRRVVMFSGEEQADRVSVRVMFSAPDLDGDRCLVLCVEDTQTAVIVAPRRDGDDQ